MWYQQTEEVCRAIRDLNGSAKISPTRATRSRNDWSEMRRSTKFAAAATSGPPPKVVPMQIHRAVVHVFAYACQCLQHTAHTCKKQERREEIDTERGENAADGRDIIAESV